MKKQFTFLKTSIVCLFLITSTTLFAQIAAPVPTTPINGPDDLNIGTLNDGVLPLTSMVDAVFFYRPDGTNALTLQASLTDASTDPITFTSYNWYEITTDGTNETAVSNPETSRDLVLSSAELQPGYHKYRVYGVVENTPGVTCQSDEFQDIVFFVLRPLAPTATPETGSITEFCLDSPPTTPVVLNANVEFGATPYYGNYPNPAVGDFSLSYQWYAIKEGDETNRIALSGNTTPVSGATNSISISDYADLLAAGTYTFEVEVQYDNAIKDRESRTHAQWTATVGGDTTPYELVVTLTPGRPTITITGVTD